MPTFISPISPAFFCDFLHVCLINNVITVFIKSHSYTYLFKNLSFIERKPSESYLLIWKKNQFKKRFNSSVTKSYKAEKWGKPRVLQIFVRKCLAVILEVLVLVTEITKQIPILSCKIYQIILNHCNDFHKKYQILFNQSRFLVLISRYTKRWLIRLLIFPITHS
jgi:hypothetical protein